MSPAILKAAVRSRNLDDKNRFPLPADGSSKILYLRPKPIFSALAPLYEKIIPILALKNIKAAVLSTREENDALTIDLTIANLLPTLNGFLNNLAESINESEIIPSEK